MKCEYCGTTHGEEVFGTCPNCGAALPERTIPSAATVGASLDEERREDLKKSGCKYCPYCLSTNVARTGAGTISCIVFFLVLSCLLTIVVPLLVVLPVILLLALWMLLITLNCGNCKAEWTPTEAKVYEKYRFQLNPVLKKQAKIQCAGINRQGLTMSIHTVEIQHGSKKRLVRYDQLMQVYHRPPAGDLFGYLTIRSMANKNRPLPKNYKEAENDLLTVVYEPEYESQYLTVYHSLKEIEQMNTGAFR